MRIPEYAYALRKENKRNCIILSAGRTAHASKTFTTFIANALVTTAWSSTSASLSCPVILSWLPATVFRQWRKTPREIAEAEYSNRRKYVIPTRPRNRPDYTNILFHATTNRRLSISGLAKFQLETHTLCVLHKRHIYSYMRWPTATFSTISLWLSRCML